MQTLDKFKLALGILWSLATLYFIVLLLPSRNRRREKSEARLKCANVKRTQPTWLQRMVFVPLSGTMSAEVLANVFHSSLAKMTGISPLAIFRMMILLSALYLALGLLEWVRKKRHGTET